MQKYLLIAILAISFTLALEDEWKRGDFLKNLLKRITLARARIIRDIIDEENRP